MLRLAITLSCGVCVAGALAPEAFAAGRSFAPAAPARMAPMRPPAVHPGPGVRPWRGAAHRPFGRYHRRFDGDGYGDPWAWPDGYGAGGGVTVIERQAEASRPIDPDAFENLTVRAGIRAAPTPEPTIYRIEGPRLRPVARVIRVAGGDEAGATPRSRFAHAETGALLLTVPRR